MYIKNTKNTRIILYAIDVICVLCINYAQKEYFYKVNTFTRKYVHTYVFLQKRHIFTTSTYIYKICCVSSSSPKFEEVYFKNLL